MRGRLLAFFCLSWCASSMADTLTVLSHRLPPYTFIDPATQTVIGISTDRIREMMKRAGQNYTIRMTSWPRAHLATLSESHTCVYNVLRDPERESSFKWIGPLFKDEWAFFARADDHREFLKLEDFRPYTVGAFRGGGTAETLTKAGYKIEPAIENDDNVRLLLHGRIDYWITTVIVGDYLVKQLSEAANFKKVFHYKTQEMYLACNSEMSQQKVDRLNAILQDMEKDGSNEKILRKYLSK